MLAPTAGSRLRSTALLLIGALVVHEARYLLAYGAQAGGVEASTGHAYLQLIAPLLVAAAAAAIVVSLVAPAIHRRLPRLADPGSATERAAGYAAALLAIFVAQEVCEALLSGGHAGALGGIAGPGGWLALPLAIAVGALIEAAARWLDRAEQRVAVAFAPAAPRAPAAIAPPPELDRAPLCSRPLAFGLSRRPPPLPAV
jgi:hypothetical protein